MCIFGFRARLITTASLILISACGSDATAPASSVASNLSPDDFAIITTEGVIVLRSGWSVLTGEIAVRFTNESQQTVSLPNCNSTYPVVLEKRNGSDWVEEWSGVMMGCVSPTIVIAPGEVFTDTLTIVAGRSGTQYYPQFNSDPVNGTYRLAFTKVFFDYEEDSAEGVLLPEELRMSNDFTIRVE